MQTSAASEDPFAPPANVDIVIGIVAPLGADVDRAVTHLTSALDAYAYTTNLIRLSSLFGVDVAHRRDLGLLEAQMNAGDQLREQSGRSDVLAGLAVSIIYSRTKDRPGRRQAWIVHTLKHEDEVSLLRSVYGQRFVLLAVGSPEDHRIDRTAVRLSRERPSLPDARAHAVGLVARDQRDEQNPKGQRVRDAFSQADHFLDLGPGLSDKEARHKFDRLVGLLFGQPFLTPTFDEFLMFTAHAASLRSSDAGRQVGAVLAGRRGDILAVGANEVPRAGGGEYWADDNPDWRDFNLGYDYNRQQIARTLRQMLDALAANELLAPELQELGTEERADLVSDRAREQLKSTRMLSLIEFGRVVHAEMAALMQAARTGVAVDGATIYTTTFPCHMCMRLIISAGISRLVFVDPYPKSLASEMYRDSLSPAVAGRRYVDVASFEGWGWARYDAIFTGVNRRREDDGSFARFDPKNARFRFTPPAAVVLATTALEVVATAELLTSMFDTDSWALINSDVIAELQPSEVENEGQK